jgi:hypothetical protein
MVMQQFSCFPVIVGAHISEMSGHPVDLCARLYLRVRAAPLAVAPAEATRQAVTDADLLD